MEKYLDIMRRTIELSETCLEGLEHIKGKLNEGRFEDTIQLMNDVVTAFSQMESSIQLIFPTLPSYHMDSLTDSLRNAFEHLSKDKQERRWRSSNSRSYLPIRNGRARWRKYSIPLSMSLSQARTMQEASTSVMKIVMNTAKTNAEFNRYV